MLLKINIVPFFFLMSFMNIGYSTLEDAWGENFDRKHKKSKSKPDPTCELYAKRYRTPTPPYSQRSKRRSHGPAFESDEDYRKYYGYTDRKSSYKPPKRPSQELRKFEVSLPAPSGYITDDELVGAEFSHNAPPANTAPKRLREVPKEAPPKSDAPPKRAPPKPPPVVEEEFDEIDAYASGESEEEQYGYIDQLYVDDDDDEEEYYVDPDEGDRLVEEEEEAPIPRVRRMPPKRGKVPCSKTITEAPSRTNEKIFLDFGIFTISGILLIFIMEQFIQIGVNFKTRAT